jgi:hypothetical protein
MNDLGKQFLTKKAVVVSIVPIPSNFRESEIGAILVTIQQPKFGTRIAHFQLHDLENG